MTSSVASPTVNINGHLVLSIMGEPMEVTDFKLLLEYLKTQKFYPLSLLIAFILQVKCS